MTDTSKGSTAYRHFQWQPRLPIDHTCPNSKDSTGCAEGKRHPVSTVCCTDTSRARAVQAAVGQARPVATQAAALAGVGQTRPQTAQAAVGQILPEAACKSYLGSSECLQNRHAQVQDKML
jgi:hypothetical protein